ncbi:MAG: SUMF1/EgtB/PvdO family nonheme iron enzyme [Gemmataceae bacterium]
MQRPPLLLQLIAKSVLSTVDSSVLDDVAVDINPDVIERIWVEWSEQSTEPEMLVDLETLARLDNESLDDLVQQTLTAESGASNAATQVLTAYLAHLPGAIRRAFRRPADPTGTTVPPGWAMKNPISLLAHLLPQQMPWYLPDDRPWDIGDWELVELYDRSSIGELWKAQRPMVPTKSRFLHFFLHPSIKEQLFRPRDSHTGLILDQVLETIHEPTILKLHGLHLLADPPCLEYEFFPGTSLSSAFHQWTPENPPNPDLVTALVGQIAKAVGHLHELEPPIVHQALRPDAILLREAASGRIHDDFGSDKSSQNLQWECKILNTGLGAIIPLEVLMTRRTSVSTVGPIGGPRVTPPVDNVDVDPMLYAAPEQLREEPAQPRIDVYAIGVMWYQMLTGSLQSQRPGGSQWRKRLIQRGLSQELVELLESCFEDDPSYRPANGSELYARMTNLLQGNSDQPTASPNSPDLGSPAVPANPTEPKPVTPNKPTEEGLVDEGLQQPTQAPQDTDASESLTQETSPDGPPTLALRKKTRTRQRRAAVDQLFDKLATETPEAAKSLSNSVEMKFVLVPAGEFLMGTTPEEAGIREKEMPQHLVSLTQDFYLAITPVTQQQYLRVMDRNPAYHNPDNGGDLNHPVENVTWANAVEFCRRLSNLPEEQEEGRLYRLPTEAEWEYACRAGTSTPFCYGEVLTSDQANFDGNFPYGEESQGIVLQKTSAVMRYPPNHFGFHDVHGNVWEWCADWLDATYYSVSPKRDPKGPHDGKYRVIRGGSWRNQGTTCRSGYRNGLAPHLKDNTTGFRVVLEIGRA